MFLYLRDMTKAYLADNFIILSPPPPHPLIQLFRILNNICVGYMIYYSTEWRKLNDSSPLESVSNAYDVGMSPKSERIIDIHTMYKLTIVYAWPSRN